MDLTPAGRFQKYFSIELANTPEARENVYRIRYNVYCKEFGYEPIENFPGQMEYDDYDSISTHLLIRHRESGIPAGCVRVVPSVSGEKITPLPFEKFCSESVDQEKIAHIAKQRKQMCEISRLAVDKIFRRRAGEGRYGNIFGLKVVEEEQRTFPLIAVAAYFSASATAGLLGKFDAFAMMEPFLPRLLKRSGIRSIKVGKEIDYHGLRAPYYFDQRSVQASLSPEMKEIYDHINTEISIQIGKKIKNKNSRETENV